MLKRIVQERVRRSKRAGKFSLEEEEDDGGGGGGLTHRVGIVMVYCILSLFMFSTLQCTNHTNHDSAQRLPQGKTIDESYTGKPQDEMDIILSDDDQDDLDKVDTMMHFGGGKFDKDNAIERGAYGGEGGQGGQDLGVAYRSRKEELEDRIRMKKFEKAERMKRKEDQGMLSSCCCWLLLLLLLYEFGWCR